MCVCVCIWRESATRVTWCVFRPSSSRKRAEFHMGWLRLVGSFKLQISSAKEPCKRADILQMRPIISRSLLIVTTPLGAPLGVWQNIFSSSRASLELHMGWLWLVGSIKLYVSFAEYSLFYRTLLQKRPIILSILLTEATPQCILRPSSSREQVELQRSQECGVATISTLLKNIGPFCRISSLLQGSFAKEDYNFKEFTNRSHPIPYSSSGERVK